MGIRGVRRWLLVLFTGELMARRYLTALEAADYLGLTLGALRMRVARRRIPFCRQGRWIRFDVRALDAWMQDGQQEVLE